MRPDSSTVESSRFFSVTVSIVCFVALVHVEIELHAHRQMLQALTQQGEENLHLRNAVHRHEETIEAVLKMSQSSPREGKVVVVLNSNTLSTGYLFRFVLV